MSSYLSIFIVPKRKVKEDVKQRIIIASYSRSTELYDYFSRIINPVCIGMSDKIPYTTITKEGIRLVLNEFNDNISKTKERLIEYERYASANADSIQDIIELKEYISDLQFWKAKVSFIEDMIDEANSYMEGIEEVCCNIG